MLLCDSDISTRTTSDVASGMLRSLLRILMKNGDICLIRSGTRGSLVALLMLCSCGTLYEMTFLSGQMNLNRLDRSS